MPSLPWILYSDRMVGRSHPSLTDTLNAALRQFVTDLGFSPDATPNPLLIALKFGAHGDTNYVLGDSTTGGQARVYSQIMAYGADTAGGADLVLMAPKHRSGGTDYDVHVVGQRVSGSNSTGVFFIDMDIKVSDFSAGTARGHGLRVLQQDNSTVMEFPISGGIILQTGKLRGQNGANLDLVLQTGGASASFVVQDNTGGSSLLTLAQATGNLATLGSITGSQLVSNTRVLSTVVGLTWAASIAVNAAAGNQFRVSASSNIAATFVTPTNAPGGSFTQEIIIEMFNGSGGALSTPPAFDSGYVLNGSAGNPANNTEIVYKFCWNSGRSKWIEVGSHTATGI